MTGKIKRFFNIIKKQENLTNQEAANYFYQSRQKYDGGDFYYYEYKNYMLKVSVRHIDKLCRALTKTMMRKI